MEIVSRESPSTNLSPWWRRGILLILVLEFSVLIWITLGTAYRNSVPPVPVKVVDSSGATLFTEADIKAGQQVLLKRGLMNNGTIWGHGAYLGPDFSAQYLHNLVLEVRNYLLKEGRIPTANQSDQEQMLILLTKNYLQENRYDQNTHNLVYTEPEKKSYGDQMVFWKNYFEDPGLNRGLNKRIIADEGELRQLNSFFSWTAWASATLVPGENFTYTNNFPHEPLLGNGPSSGAILWSALSLITLLGGIALILFFFGRYEYLGWKSDPSVVPTGLMPGNPNAIESSAIKFILVAILVLFVQTLAGGALAHYFVESKGFYQFDLSRVFSSNILRTWHLQSSILWIATAYIGGGIFLSSILSNKIPKYQVPLTNFLFIALAVALFGGMIGEYLGINNIIKDAWFWFGNQGWEYLEIGRGWQILVAVGLVLWVFLLFRSVKPSRREPEERELKTLFLLAAFAIPFFYLPAFFIGSTTHFSNADTWRFWIIHLWVEGFFEVFATVMVAILFYKLGLVRKKTATRLIYLDAVLFLGAGILGTGHHWYWNGQTATSMAISACFSAMEVVPLILLTLEASDFYKLRRMRTDEKGKNIPFAHKWAFYFLIAVGVWNFVGAGVFGFLINLPVISYYETGTNLTANHGHGALMGVFGMLAIAFSVFALRQVSTDEHWRRIEKFIKISFWGLNLGLAGMILLQLFPSGVIQFLDVIKNGYWHARSLEFSGQSYMTNLAWLRFPADVLFIVGGVLPLLYAVILTYGHLVKTEKRFI